MRVKFIEKRGLCVCTDADMDAGRLARQDAAAEQEEGVGDGVDGCRLVGLRAR